MAKTAVLTERKVQDTLNNSPHSGTESVRPVWYRCHRTDVRVTELLTVTGHHFTAFSRLHRCGHLLTANSIKFTILFVLFPTVYLQEVPNLGKLSNLRLPFTVQTVV